MSLGHGGQAWRDRGDCNLAAGRTATSWRSCVSPTPGDHTARLTRIETLADRHRAPSWRMEEAKQRRRLMSTPPQATGDAPHWNIRRGRPTLSRMDDTPQPQAPGRLGTADAE